MKKICVKKICGILLALAMVLAMIPAAAVTAHAGTVASGKCSDEVTWVLSDDGTLTFSGTGAIPDMMWWEKQLLLGQSETVRRVIVNEGITEVEQMAFRMLVNCTTLTIPASVTSIGKNLFNYGSLQKYIVSANNRFYSSDGSGVLYDKEKTSLLAYPIAGPAKYAVPEGVEWISGFKDCTRLTSLTLPGTLQVIGDDCFNGCTGLSSLEIPSGLSQIGTRAFYHCTALRSIRIPALVWGIGYEVFMDCTALTGIWVDKDNEYYASDKQGVLFNKDMTTLYAYPGSGPSSYEVPATVTMIDSNAFYRCGKLKAINFPGNAPEISGDAFTGVTATACYPGGDETWTEEMRVNYGGTLTWKVFAAGSWQKNSVGWWYRNWDGSYPANCWQEIDGKWYHFDKDGYMQTGWLKDDGYWFYLTANGDMVTGWRLISGKWYWFNSGGGMVTGWKLIDGKWYWFTSNGDMVTGWKQLSGKWYYFTGSGDMVTGWRQISGTKYYFTGNGDMVTGWRQINEKWYYFNSGGAMQYSKWIGDYYLKADGSMAVDEWIGEYYVGPDGKWVPGAKRPQGDTVWWTPNGEVYHTHRDCVSLKRSSEILSGTIEEAISHGKSRLCNICANMG